MLPLYQTLIDLRQRADPLCLHCQGNGYILGPQKEMLVCGCVRGHPARGDPSMGTELLGGQDKCPQK